MVKSLDAKQVQKRSTVALAVPTVPASNDHTDGTWTATDVYSGEVFINETDGKAYIRIGAAIKELVFGGGAGGIYTASGTVPTTIVATVTDTLKFEGGTVIIKGGAGDDVIDLQSSAGASFMKLDSAGQFTMNGEDWVKWNAGAASFDIGDTTRMNHLLGIKTIIDTETQTNKIRGGSSADTGVEYSLRTVTYKSLGSVSAQTHHLFKTIGSTHNDSALWVVANDVTNRYRMNGDGRAVYGTGVPDASALLELKSTTHGFLLPRMTHTQAGAITTTDGVVIYVTSTDATFTAIGIWARENGAWAKL